MKVKPHSKNLGKLKKYSKKPCPDCDGMLEVRDYDGISLTICPSCGYEEESKKKRKRLDEDASNTESSPTHSKNAKRY